jgi:hypothetical protein
MHSSDTGEKCECTETALQLFIDIKKADDSVGRGELDNILTEFGVPKKLVLQIKMCLNETHIKFRISKHFSDKEEWRLLGCYAVWLFKN